MLARRTDTRGARQVTIPYFATVLRGGTAVISKRIGQVTLNFPASSVSLLRLFRLTHDLPVLSPKSHQLQLFRADESIAD